MVAMLPPMNINIRPTNKALQVKFQLQVNLRLLHPSRLEVEGTSSEFDLADRLDDFLLELSFMARPLQRC